MDLLPAAEKIHVAALKRPLWSCADGAMLFGGHNSEASSDGSNGSADRSSSSNAAGSLQTILIETLATLRVSWPQTVEAIGRYQRQAACVAGAGGAEGSAAVASDNGGSSTANLRASCVDYGPGGGSGATRMGSVVADELGLNDALHFSYFSQQHCIPGRLPQSWLAWLKTPEENGAVAAERGGSGRSKSSSNASKALGKAAATPSLPNGDKSSSTSNSNAKAGRKFVWFSDRIKNVTGNAAVIDFGTPELMAAISPELEKAKLGREAARHAMQYKDVTDVLLASPQYAALRVQQTRSYDPARYPFQQAFAQLLALPLDMPMHLLHTRFNGDQGSKRDRREKKLMMQPLTDADARADFVQLYEQFVLEVLAPLASDAMAGSGDDDSNRVVFQSFPCVRVHRPNEFSIGPHCDAQYQLPDGNLNVWLPLTSAADTNSIYLESSPGKEDFKPLNVEYGDMVTFYGAYCTHFAVENLSGRTRVSLDFRVSAGNLYDSQAAAGLADNGKGERGVALGTYFSECTKDPATGKFAVTKRGYPNHRHGFPHTNR